jgi:hypothetical protein
VTNETNYPVKKCAEKLRSPFVFIALGFLAFFAQRFHLAKSAKEIIFTCLKRTSLFRTIEKAIFNTGAFMAKVAFLGIFKKIY